MSGNERVSWWALMPSSYQRLCVSMRNQRSAAASAATPTRGPAPATAVVNDTRGAGQTVVTLRLRLRVGSARGQMLTAMLNSKDRMPLRVQIVTAEREVLAEDAVDMVVAPGAEGVVGILPRHAPLLTTLLPGVVRIKKGGTEESMAVGGGFLQVARDQVLILADTAERADEVDEARAEEGRRRAGEKLAESGRSGHRLQAETARFALRREEARIHVVRRRRGPERHRPGPGASDQ